MGNMIMKMNFLTKFICCSAVMMLAAALHAKTISMGFQIGDIVAAEMSKCDLRIIDRENSPYPNAYRNPVYVVVVLKLLPMRSINSEDYSLRIGNITAKCMGTTTNNGNFISSSQSIFANGNDYQRMVFIFDGNRLRSNGKPQSAILVSHLSGRGSVRFNVTDIGKKTFCDTQKIPKNGLLK